MTKRWLPILLVVLLPACASDIAVGYPSPAGAAPAGTVLVRFTEAMRSATVRIDGVLVVEDEHTERIEVANVPAGRREVTVVASSRGRSRSIDHTEVVAVDPEKPAVVLIATPAHSLGYWMYASATALAWGIAAWATR